jgi:hypothetical protein
LRGGGLLYDELRLNREVQRSPAEARYLVDEPLLTGAATGAAL